MKRLWLALLELLFGRRERRVVCAKCKAPVNVLNGVTRHVRGRADQHFHNECV